MGRRGYSTDGLVVRLFTGLQTLGEQQHRESPLNDGVINVADRTALAQDTGLTEQDISYGINYLMSHGYISYEQRAATGRRGTRRVSHIKVVRELPKVGERFPRSPSTRPVAGVTGEGARLTAIKDAARTLINAGLTVDLAQVVKSRFRVSAVVEGMPRTVAGREIVMDIVLMDLIG